jgi:hypothetical protein
MVIGSLYPISVEGLRWGIDPEGAEALSSHHIWTFKWEKVKIRK